MGLHYQILNWDTDFFGFKVCKFSNMENSKDSLIDINCIMRKNKIRLGYYVSNKELHFPKFNIDNFNIKLVDKKTTFIKDIDSTLEFHSMVSTYENSLPNAKLIDLAIQSGVFSRFNIDDEISDNKFEAMYRIWIENSTKRKIANEVLVFRQDDDIAGFVTLGEKNDRGDIGIIAVDSQYRGQGIGKILMINAEKWFFNNFYKKMQVVTQGSNLAACKFYDRLGYDVESVVYFYHIWNKY